MVRLNPLHWKVFLQEIDEMAGTRTHSKDLTMNKLALLQKILLLCCVELIIQRNYRISAKQLCFHLHQLCFLEA